MSDIEKKSAPSVGVILINVGTPEAPTVPAVRRYLREFLSDPYVVDLPKLLRWLLLNLVILPFRPKKSAAAYKMIWTESGSPLMTNTQELCAALQNNLGEKFYVTYAMRYGGPSIDIAVRRLQTVGCTDWVMVPLYPQYAKSTTETSWQELLIAIQRNYLGKDEPYLHDMIEFYNNPHYQAALAEVTKESLVEFDTDCLLMSYHGLPERHLSPPICSTGGCDKQSHSCPEINGNNAKCYRAQCYATSRSLAKSLHLTDGEYAVSFQSRLGKAAWIGPETQGVLSQLYAKGVRSLAVVMPAFVADCLESLEEVGCRLREQWLEMDGTSFHLVPCLNAHPAWVRAMSQMICECVPIKPIDMNR